MIRFSEIAVGSGGGVRCMRCHPVRPDEFDPVEEVVARIQNAAATWVGRPGPNVALGGAEPFGHPALPDLVAAAMRSGVQRLRLDTDAGAMRSPNNAAGVLSAGVRHVRFTVLGGTPGLHDALAGTPGGLDATSAGIGMFGDAAAAQGTRVCVTALVPVCRHNVHDVPAAVGSAVAIGADSVVIRVELSAGDLAAAARWVMSACDTGVVNGAWVSVEGMPGALLPGYGLHLIGTAARNGCEEADRG